MKRFIIVLSLMLGSLGLLTSVSVSAKSASGYTPEVFEATDTYLSMKLSPDGKTIAATTFNGEEYSIVFFDAEDMSVKDVMALRYPDVLGRFYWATNERLVFHVFRYFYSEDGLFNIGELLSVEVGDKRGKFIFGYRAGKGNFNSSKAAAIAAKHRNMSKAWVSIADLLLNEPNHILVAATPWSVGATAKTHIYKLNITDGNIEPISILDRPYARVFTDGQGKIIGAQTLDSDYRVNVLLYDQGEDKWNPAPGLEDYRDFDFSYFDLQRQRVNFLSVADGKRLGLHSYDLKSHKVAALYTHDKVDIERVLRTQFLGQPYALGLMPQGPEYIPLNNPPLTGVFGAMINGYKGHLVNIVSASADKKRVIYSVESDVKPMAYYLYDANTNKNRQLAQANDGLAGLDYRHSQPFTFSTQDHNIPGYITLPKVKKGKKAPVVVMFTSNPQFKRHFWRFSRQAQYFSAHGYAVVQLNLPGVEGYGNDYDHVDSYQWGADNLKNARDALHWLAEQHPIQPDQACGIGRRFGAHMALMASRYYPETFRCAVSESGVYDFIEFQREDRLGNFNFGAAYFDLYLGKDDTELAKLSAIAHADNFSQPVLFIHHEHASGDGFEHAETLHNNLKKRGVATDFIPLGKAARAKDDYEDRVKVLKAISGFLQQHLDD